MCDQIPVLSSLAETKETPILHGKFRLISGRKPKVFVSKILRHYLTKEGRVRKLFYCLMPRKEPCVQRNFEGLTRSTIFGILQTVMESSFS